MNDVVIPNFHSRSANGEIFNNAMDSVTEIETDPVLSYYAANLYTALQYCGDDDYRQAHRGTRTWGTMPTSLFTKNASAGQYWAPTPTVDVSYLIQKAVTQAWSNIDTSEVLSLVSIAESKKTVLSLASILWRLVKILKAAKNLRFKELKAELSRKELAQRWMELRYALRPLYYETHQIINAITYEGKNTDRFTFRGHASDSSSEDVSRAHANGDLRFNLRAIADREVSVRSGVLTHIETINKLNVWGLTKVAESAWELVPYSFVVDWILNVGQTIGSWTPEMGVTSLASWYVVTDTTYRHTWIDGPVNFVECATPSVECVASLSTPGRTKLTVSKYRVPNPKRSILPSFSIRLDAAKLLDLVVMGRRIR
jgi:hypothetical protein